MFSFAMVELFHRLHNCVSALEVQYITAHRLICLYRQMLCDAQDLPQLFNDFSSDEKSSLV
jgi:hypothetical protein